MLIDWLIVLEEDGILDDMAAHIKEQIEENLGMPMIFTISKQED